MNTKTLKIITIFFFVNLNIFFTYSISIAIYPVDKKQSSGIYVKKGDKLKFEVSGKWTLWDKYKPVGGEGHQFVSNELGNWGALCAKIGTGNAFTIGKGIEIVSDNEGVLYFFPNKGKYKIQNESGNLDVKIEGGTNLQDFINELAKKAKKIIFDPKEKIFITNIFIEKGEILTFYAFGNWTLWQDTYPEVTAEGHEFTAEGVNWGKLFGGIGSSSGQFLEIFPIGEKAEITASQTGILSLFPYISNFETDEKGKLEIYIIGGRKVSKTDRETVDNFVRSNTENQILNRLNELRTSCDLPKLEINDSFSKSAFNHAKYMISNNILDRTEDENKTFFTGKTIEERLLNLGYKGNSRELFCETESALHAIDLFLNSVYHRLRILNPDLKYIGYGGYKSTTRTIHVFDFGYYNEDEKISWDKIIYPPNDSTEISVNWSGIENPDPLPSGAVKPVGYPVSIMFKKQLKKVLKAEVIDEQGNIINSYIITPENDRNNKQINAVVIVPKLVLSYNTKYSVNIKVILSDGKDEETKEYNWSFLTQGKISGN